MHQGPEYPSGGGEPPGGDFAAVPDWVELPQGVERYGDDQWYESSVTRGGVVTQYKINFACMVFNRHDTHLGVVIPSVAPSPLDLRRTLVSGPAGIERYSVSATGGEEAPFYSVVRWGGSVLSMKRELAGCGISASYSLGGGLDRVKVAPSRCPLTYEGGDFGI